MSEIDRELARRFAAGVASREPEPENAESGRTSEGAIPADLARTFASDLTGLRAGHQPRGTDLIYSGLKGFVNVASGVAQGLHQMGVPGAKEVNEDLHRVQKFYEEHQSPGIKSATVFAQPGEEGLMGDNWKWAVMSAVVESAPFMMLSIPAGGVLTKALTGTLGGRAAAIAGAAVGEGLLGGAINADDTYRQVRENIPLSVLEQTEEFQTALAQTPADMPMADRKRAARDAVAKSAARIVGAITTGTTALFGAPSAAAMAKLMGGEAGKNALTTIVKQVFLEGVIQEAPQSVAELYAQRTQLMPLDPSAKMPTLREVKETAGTGAIVGGIMGGGFALPMAISQSARAYADRQRELMDVEGAQAQPEAPQAPQGDGGLEDILREAAGEDAASADPVQRAAALAEGIRAGTVTPEELQAAVADLQAQFPEQAEAILAAARTDVPPDQGAPEGPAAPTGGPQAPPGAPSPAGGGLGITEAFTGAAQAITENWLKAQRKSIEETGYMMSPERQSEDGRGSLQNQLYEAIVAATNQRGIEQFENAMDIYRRSGGDAKRAYEIFKEEFQKLPPPEVDEPDAEAIAAQQALNEIEPLDAYAQYREESGSQPAEPRPAPVAADEDIELALKELPKKRKAVDEAMGKPQAWKADSSVDDALSFLQKTKAHGTTTSGLNAQEAVAQGVDPAAIGGKGGRHLFTKGGMSFDQAAEFLNEAGYPNPYARGTPWDPNSILQLVTDQKDLPREDRVHTGHGAERVAQLKAIAAEEEALLDAQARNEQERQARVDEVARRMEEDGYRDIRDAIEDAFETGIPPAVPTSELFAKHGILDTDVTQEEDTLLALALYAYEFDPEGADAAMQEAHAEEAVRQLMAIINSARGTQSEGQQEQPAEGEEQAEAEPAGEIVGGDATPGGTTGEPPRGPVAEGEGEMAGPEEGEGATGGAEPEPEGEPEAEPEGEPEGPVEEPPAKPEPQPEVPPAEDTTSPDYEPTDADKRRVVRNTIKPELSSLTGPLKKPLTTLSDRQLGLDEDGDNELFLDAHARTIDWMKERADEAAAEQDFATANTLYGFLKEVTAETLPGSDEDVVLNVEFYKTLSRSFTRKRNKAIKETEEAEKQEAINKAVREGLAERFNVGGEAPYTTLLSSEYRADYRVGFTAAMEGKARSHLPPAEGSFDGYDDAIRWFQTEEGEKWAPAQRRTKKDEAVKGKGIELERDIDEMRKNFRDKETVEGKLEAIFSKAQPKRHFNPTVGKKLTHGGKRYIDWLQRGVESFKQYALNELSISKWTDQSPTEAIVAWVKEADNQDVALERVAETAEKWMRGVSAFGRIFNGVNTVDEISTAIRKSVLSVRSAGINWPMGLLSNSSLSGWRLVKSLEKDAPFKLDEVIRYNRDMEGNWGIKRLEEQSDDPERQQNTFNIKWRDLYLAAAPTLTMKEGFEGVSKVLRASVWSFQNPNVEDQYASNENDEFVDPKDLRGRPPMSLNRSGEWIEQWRETDKETGLQKDATADDYDIFGFGAHKGDDGKTKYSLTVGTKWTGQMALRLREHMNLVYDSLRDMAKLFNWDPKALAHGGWLHMSLGRLGVGNRGGMKFAAAWFQASPVPVINIINNKGNGTLGHEWMHSLDIGGLQGQYASSTIDEIKRFLANRIKNDPQGFIDSLLKRYYTLEITRDGEVRPKDNYDSVRTADGDFIDWQAPGEKKLQATLQRAMHLLETDFNQFVSEFGLSSGTQFRAAAVMLDNGDEGKYWSKPVELFARAGEAYLWDKLAEQGAVNNYLVHDWAAPDNSGSFLGRPFPQGEERKLFNKAYDALFNAITFGADGRGQLNEPVDLGLSQPIADGHLEVIRDWVENFDQKLKEHRKPFEEKAKNAAEAIAEEERKKRERDEAMWGAADDDAGVEYEDSPADNKPWEEVTDEELLEMLEREEALMQEEEEGVDETDSVEGEPAVPEAADGAGVSTTGRGSAGGPVSEGGAAGGSGGTAEMESGASDGPDSEAGGAGPGRGGRGAGAQGAGGRRVPRGRRGAGKRAGESPVRGNEWKRGLRDSLTDALGDVEVTDDLVDAFSELEGVLDGYDGPTKLTGAKLGAVEIPKELDDLYDKLKPVFTKIFDSLLSKGLTEAEAIRATFRTVQSRMGYDIKLLILRFNQEYKAGEVDGLKQHLKTTEERATRRRQKLQERGVMKASKQTVELKMYEVYTAPSDVTSQFKNTKVHPTQLVESATMASTESPPISYQISDLTTNSRYVYNEDKGDYERVRGRFDPVASGDISDAQLHAVAMFGNATQHFLENGKRRGFFDGDGTGVGKGRTIGAIMRDNNIKGHGNRRAVWVTKNKDLFSDATRDIAGVGGDINNMVFQPKTGKGNKLTSGMDEAYIVTTYDQLKTKKRGLKLWEATTIDDFPRLKQLVDDLGPDFDGVIIFDEAHQMGGTALREQGASLYHVTGMMLQEALPKARIGYFSATGATELHNLSYLDRLGMWGENMPFLNAADFVQKMKKGGIGAMEAIARDIKALGMYLSRAISFEGVQQGQLNHSLSDEEKRAYEQFVRMWGTVRVEYDKAADKSGLRDLQEWDSAKRRWVKVGAKKASDTLGKLIPGRQQAFFDQAAVSMQTTSVVEHIKKVTGWNEETKTFADNGEAAVIQLTSTNEAIAERIREREGLDDDVDVDVSVTEIISDFLRKHFPAYRAVIKYNTNKKGDTYPVAVFDESKPIPEMIALRDQLIAQVEALPDLPNAIDVIINTFGKENVAEATGRKSTRELEEEAGAFMDDQKRILVFSKKGGTGKSYHADKNRRNTRLRNHYMLQAGWKADDALQGLGRTHRAGQAQPPQYWLVTTDIDAQKRFIATIALRLKQLGALTKGQRQAGSNDLFSEEQDINVPGYVSGALQEVWLAIRDRRITYWDIANEREATVSISLWETLTQKKLTNKKGDFQQKLDYNLEDFLNGILLLPVDMGNAIFKVYMESLTTAINAAKANGTFSAGLENIEGDEIVKLEDRVVETGAPSVTRYVQLGVKHQVTPMAFSEFKEMAQQFVGPGKGGHLIWAINKTTKRLSALLRKPNDHQYERWEPRPVGITERRVESYTQDKRSEVYTWDWANGAAKEGSGLDKRFEVIGASDSANAVEAFRKAGQLWNEQAQKWTEENDGAYLNRLHFITGAMLPIWDRLPDESNVKIRRAIVTPDSPSDTPEVLIGRVIPPSQIDDVMEALGAAVKEQAKPEDLLLAMKEKGATVVLANGDKISYRSYGYTKKGGGAGMAKDFVIETKESVRYTKYGAVHGRDWVGQDKDIGSAALFAGKSNVVIAPRGALDTLRKIVNRYPVVRIEGVEVEAQADLVEEAEEAPKAESTGELKLQRIPEDEVSNLPKWLTSRLLQNGKVEPLYKVTGKTYENREAIKSAGHAVWWNDQKAWVIAERNASAFMEALGGKVSFSLRGPVGGAGMEAQDVSGSVSGLQSGFFGTSLDVRTVQSFEQLPEHIRRQRPEGSTVEAAFDPATGHIWVVADAIVSPDHLQAVLTEEIFGHYGLRALLGKGFRPFLRDVWKKYRNDPRMAQIVETYGINASTPDGQLMAADEMVAKLARDVEALAGAPSKDRSILQRIIKAIKRFASQLPVIGDYISSLTDEDVRQMLLKARDGVRNGSMPPKELVADILFSARPQTIYGRDGNVIKAAAAPLASGQWVVYWATGQTLLSGGARQELYANRRQAEVAMGRAGLDISVRRDNFGPRPQAKPVFDNFTVPNETGFEWFLRKAQDRFRRLLTVQRAIRKQGGRIDIETDTYRAEERLHGLVFERIRAFEDEYVQPLIDYMSEYGITLDDLDLFMYAQHAPERNARMAERNPKLAETVAANQNGMQLSGMTDAEAAQILRDVDREGRTDVMEEAATMVRRLLNHQLGVWRTEGLESEETIRMLEDQYDFYVPLKGKSPERMAYDGDMGVGFHMLAGRGLSVRGKEFRVAYGRASRASDIVLNAVAQVEQTLIRAEKNRVGKTFLKMVQQNPNEDLWTVNEVQYVPRFNEDGEIEYVPAGGRPRDAMVVKVDGKENHIIIKDPILRGAMLSINDSERVGLLTSMLGTLTRTLAALNTSMNVEFGVVNFIRDLQTALIHVQDEGLLDDISMTPAQRAAIRDTDKLGRKVITWVGPAMRGAYRSLRGKEAGEWGEWFDKYRKAGGKIEFYSLRSVEQKRREFQRKLRLASSNTALAQAELAVRDIGKWLQDFNGGIENASRLATFRALVENGAPVEVAASVARNLTVNFNRKGEAGNIFNALYMFFNASVQGSYRMLSAVARSRKMQKFVVGATVASAVWAFVTRMLMGVDDKDGRWYYDDDIPDWVKDHNLIIPALWSDDEGEYIKIPMPYGYNVINVLGNVVMEIATGQMNTPEKAVMGAQRLVVQFIDAFNPMGDTASLLQLVSPTVVDPFLQSGMNENFFGAPIRPEAPTWAKYDVPKSQLYWSSVSPMSKAVAQRVNALTGGSEYKPGWIDVSPETIDHFVQFMTGGGGATLWRGITVGVNAVTGEETSPREIPFYRRFKGVPAEYRPSDTYRKNVAEVEAARLSLRDAIKAGDKEKAAQVRSEYGQDLSLVPAMKATERRLKKLFALRRQVTDSQLPAALKQQRLKKVNEEIADAQKAFNKRFDAASATVE